MSLPINIEDLINQRTVEQTRIEYKKSWNAEPILHSITAFANDFDNLGGGYIIIGIEEENGRPKFPVEGLNTDSIDEIQLDILNKCNLIEPRYIPVIEPVKYENKTLLVLWIPGGEERPYKCPEKIFTDRGAKKSQKNFWIRKGSRTLKANHLEERELIGMARDIPFDDRINYQASVEDLKPALISDYLHEVGSELSEKSLDRPIEDVGTDMRIIRGPSEYLKPVNVGLMFFNDRPDNFFPYARIEVVDKPDPTGHNMVEKIFTGPIDRQLEDALSYIRNYIIKEYITKVSDRAEAVRTYNYPYRAVEEALSNAIYHRSYQIQEPITVTVTPEKMEILSLPGPDRSISDDDIKNNRFISRRYRNRRIGDFLKELKLVEGRNTGIPLILEAMKENGSPEPVFETDEDRSYFLTILPVQKVFLKNEHINTESNNKIRRNRTELRQLIIDTLKINGRMSMNEIAESLGYKKLTNALRETVKAMIADGEVQYLFPDKPNSRQQKIFLTSKK